MNDREVRGLKGGVLQQAQSRLWHAAESSYPAVIPAIEWIQQFDASHQLDWPYPSSPSVVILQCRIRCMKVVKRLSRYLHDSPSNKIFLLEYIELIYVRGFLFS